MTEWEARNIKPGRIPEKAFKGDEGVLKPHKQNQGRYALVLVSLHYIKHVVRTKPQIPRPLASPYVTVVELNRFAVVCSGALGSP